MKKVLFLILFVFSGFLVQATEIVEMITTYQADYGALRRLYSNSLSTEYFSRIQKFNQDYLANLGKVNYNSLSEDDKIDYVLFRNHLEKELAELGKDRLTKFLMFWLFLSRWRSFIEAVEELRNLILKSSLPVGMMLLKT